MMIAFPTLRMSFLLALTAAAVFRIASAGNDDDGVADEAYYHEDGYDGNTKFYYNEGEYIQYWTDYAILPKRCIVYNNVDVLVFSIFDNQFNQCSDDPVGTYIVPVPQYIQGYVAQKQQDMEDQGYEDYEEPAVAQYAYCTPYQIQGVYYYFQIGCSDETSQELAVNIYSDKDCTTRSVVDGMDDSNLDPSDITPKFKKCMACVNWFDRDDDVDDQFYENRKMNAPLCSTAWTYKETCGRKCQHAGLEKQERETWAASDKVLLAILTAFGLIMLGLIIRKRIKMSNKDTLLEQAALSTAGLQQPHVIGIFILIILVITVFALLGLKNITWGLLLVMNTVLFAYLMKLTISSVNSEEAIVGPDGQIVRQDSSDSSVETDGENNAGTYSLPVLA